MGNVIKCKMNDLMRDLAKSVVRQECLSNLEGENIDERTHHLLIVCNSSAEQGIAFPLHKVEKIRTFLLPVGAFW